MGKYRQESILKKKTLYFEEKNCIYKGKRTKTKAKSADIEDNILHFMHPDLPLSQTVERSGENSEILTRSILIDRRMGSR